MDTNALIPICFIVFLGAILKKSHLIDNAFIEKAIDLMHLVLLPIVIFWTIAENIKSVNIGWEVYLAALFSTVTVLFIGHLYIFVSKTDMERALVFSMSCYRSNVYLGLALIYYLFDQRVFSEFCIFLLFFIPIADVMAKISTSWILKGNKKNEDIVRPLARLIFLNPIIIAGVLGILLSNKNIPHPLFITKFFNFIYPTIFPLALVLTGAILSQIKIESISVLSATGSILKTILLPFFGYLSLKFFSASSEIFGVMIIFLSLPYMLDRKIPSTSFAIQREVMMPFCSVSALFSFIVISITLYMLN